MDTVRGRKVVYENNALAVVETDDGSHTLYHQSLDETYHSLRGALTESLYVYIREGLLRVYKGHSSSPINVLEIGFGTGLNTMLTLERATIYSQPINYLSLEPYPLSVEVIEKLNYPKYLDSRVKNQFFLIHELEWNIPHTVNPYFHFTKMYNKLPELSESVFTNSDEESSSRFRENFDLVYYDAFGLSKQGEPWEENNFAVLSSMMVEGGVLVTYASNNQLKDYLVKNGFVVETLTGPPGKKEMTRATKK